MQTSCRPHANLVQTLHTSCQPRANLVLPRAREFAKGGGETLAFLWCLLHVQVVEFNMKRFPDCRLGRMCRGKEKLSAVYADLMLYLVSKYPLRVCHCVWHIYAPINPAGETEECGSGSQTSDVIKCCKMMSSNVAKWCHHIATSQQRGEIVFHVVIFSYLAPFHNYF